MNIDYSKTKEFYKNYNDLCDCEMCLFYYQNVINNYPDLYNYLNERNINIQKPFDLGYPYINDKGNIIYPIAQYVVIGECKDDFSIYLDGVSLSKGKFYPNVSIVEPYFVLDLYNVSFNKNIVSSEIINNL